MYSQSTADLLTVANGRIGWVFNRSGATRTIVLDISKAFDGVQYANLLHKLSFYGISGHVFGFISSLLSNRWLRVVLDGKSSQKYPVNAEFLKAPFLVLRFSYSILITILRMLSVMLRSMLILLSTLTVSRHLSVATSRIGI